MVATHPKKNKRVRQWAGALHAACNRMKRPRLAVEEQAAEKQVQINVDQNVSAGNALYLQKLDHAFSDERCRVIEIVCDASPFGGTDMELLALFSASTGVSGFCSPLLLRHLKPRAWLAGRHVWQVLPAMSSFHCPACLTLIF